MHASVLFFFAALSQGVLAMECKKGLHYCGSSLLKNDEIDQIFNALDKAGVKDRTEHIAVDSLYECLATRDGQVKYITTCNDPCREGPLDGNDSCS